MSVTVTRISKRFEKFPALRDVSLEVGTGELVALLGPSGSGKTTLLRVIAGLEIPDAGRVAFAGEDVTDKNAYERRAGFVFQAYALFQHMTVFENIAFGLRVMTRQKRPNAAAIKKRVDELLQLIQLETYGDRLPSQLSGGQRQRVALARALAVGRACCCSTNRSAHSTPRCARSCANGCAISTTRRISPPSLSRTTRTKLFELADRVAVFNEGRIQQVGAPADLRENPKNDFVREFLEV